MAFAYFRVRLAVSRLPMPQGGSLLVSKPRLSRSVPTSAEMSLLHHHKFNPHTRALRVPGSSSSTRPLRHGPRGHLPGLHSPGGAAAHLLRRQTPTNRTRRTKPSARVQLWPSRPAFRLQRLPNRTPVRGGRTTRWFCLRTTPVATASGLLTRVARKLRYRLARERIPLGTFRHARVRLVLTMSFCVPRTAG